MNNIKLSGFLSKFYRIQNVYFYNLTNKKLKRANYVSYLIQGNSLIYLFWFLIIYYEE